MKDKNPLDEFLNKTTLLNKIANSLFNNDKKKSFSNKFISDISCY